MADFAEDIDDSELRRLLIYYTGGEIGPITKTTRSLYIKKLNNLIRAQGMDLASMRSNLHNPRHESPKSKKPYNTNGFSDCLHSTSNKGFSSDESDGEYSQPPKSNRLCDGGSNLSSSLTRPSLRPSSSKYSISDSGHKTETHSNGWTTVHKSNKPKSGEYFSEKNSVRSSETSRSDSDRNSQNISLFVLAAGGVFFITVAYMYLYCGYNAIVFNDPRDSFILCPKNPKTDASDSDICVRRQDLNKVQDLLASIIQLARSMKGDYECGYRDNPSLSREEVEDFILQNSLNVNPEVIFELFNANLHWDTKTYDKDRKLSVDSSQINFIETEEFRMPLMCRVKRTAIHVFTMLCICTTVIASCLATRTFWKRRQKQMETFSKEMNELMEKIIDVLKQHSNLCELKPQSYQQWLPVLTVRDLIIPLEERKRKKMVWERAVQQLKSRESNLAWKKEFVAGEECEVMRWVSLSANKSHQNGSTKTWQGSAIGGDSPKKVINKLYPPLTNCLKVRNMFDLSVEVGDDWKLVIRDAILEKVGIGHGILHIVVDDQSKDGCVYVRCKDEDSAGQTFTNLHGWWFDGRLVTVKYLRPQRFVERFPDTIMHDTPLSPSNPARLSLSVPAHSSILENS